MFGFGLFLAVSVPPPSVCSSLPSTMTWAPCPHGVRTRGKKRMQPKKPAHPVSGSCAACESTADNFSWVGSAGITCVGGGAGGRYCCCRSPTYSPWGTARPPTLAPANDWPPRQATSSRLPVQQCMGMFTVVLRKTARKSIYHRRVHLHTQRSALSSEPEKRLNAPLPHSSMGPHNCLHLSLQTFGSE